MFCVRRCSFVLRPSGARLGHHVRGKHPEHARTIKQRLDEINRVDPFFARKVDIGPPVFRASRSDELAERLAYVRQHRKNPEVEKAAREKRLLVDLEDVEREWMRHNGPLQIRTVATHYGIYEHLYGDGRFVPRLQLNISYPIDGDRAAPVYHGNPIKPTEAKVRPDVSYLAASDDTFYTLVLSNLDGHLTEPDKEYVHWCVANIPGGDVDRGDSLVEYLQPIPPKGTGYHRYVFVLYKQERKMDYDIKRVLENSPLEERTFVTRDWYAKHQDDITPVGLSFFQSDWDPGLVDVYHKKLNMKEPIYEYDFPKPYFQPQVRHPLRKSFNVYLDKYRHPGDVRKEHLLLKLKKEHPFKEPEPPLKFPNALPYPKDMPTWLTLKLKHDRLGWGRIKEVE